MTDVVGSKLKFVSVLDESWGRCHNAGVEHEDVETIGLGWECACCVLD